ncbi:MAG: IS1595 family transposase [Chloroflexi bacterium]|nr:IS1595 family transposase [Chloroflexota bacterium]
MKGDTEMNSDPQTLIEAIRYFADPDVCLDFMVSLRWPNGVACPTCGSLDIRFIPTRRIWECKSEHPKRQFSVKVGTIFEDSPISLDKWLAAIWLIANAKNGVSSYEVARDLDVTQKTAWFMLHRIRTAMADDGDNPFSGQVEVDETFIGGKARFMHKDKRAEKITGRGANGKTAVVGLLERHGIDKVSQVRTEVIPNTQRRSLSPIVRDNVMAGSEVLTDALRSYDDLKDIYIHQVIDHAEAYVKGHIHTNSIENFWSLLKRAIRGTYVNVEPLHLFRYLAEETFRYNTRKTNDGSRFQKVAGAVSGKRLTYKQLIGATTTPA